jgi:hypothetical protein
MSKLEITTKIGCQVNCRYCPQQKLIKAYARRSAILDMDMETFTACLETIPTNVALHFSGMCEPWLNPHCTEMVLYAAQRGYAVMASTTLIGMGLNDLARLETIPLTRLNVHLPSAGDGGEHIAVDAHYMKILDRLLCGQINVKLRFLGTALHPDVAAFLKHHPIQHVQTHTRAGNQPIPNRPLPTERKGKIGCIRKFRQNVLLPNGDVALCCMDYSLQHILGNLQTETYATLFQSAEFRRVQQGACDETSSILCRACDDFAYPKSFWAQIRPGHVSKLLKTYGPSRWIRRL